MLKLKFPIILLDEIKINFFSIFLLFIIFFMLFSTRCTTPTEPNDPIIIPTTESKGPGGPAYLYGSIRDYIHSSKPATNIFVTIMNQQDYTDTVLSIFVNSTDGSFKITDLPTGKYDVIFESENYLCTKLGKLNFISQGNSFYNFNSTGYFIDSTIYITNIADSVGRPDAPEFGLQGYGPAIGVYLKSETPDSIGWQIVQIAGCDTLRVWRYNDPVFDPYENDVYYLHCHSIKNIKSMLIFFNYQKTILLASSVYEVIEH